MPFSRLFELMIFPPVGVIILLYYAVKKRAYLKTGRVHKLLPFVTLILVTIGATFNMLAVFSNHLKMPVSISIANRIRMSEYTLIPDPFITHSIANSTTHLRWLTDILGNGASIGDCFIVICLLALAGAWSIMWVKMVKVWRRRRLIKGYYFAFVLLPLGVCLFLVFFINFTAVNFVWKL